MKISLGLLGVTALLQVVVVIISASVALPADTVHNFSDALTALPLWVAFVNGPPPREPAHCGNVHHAHHDRPDDQGRQHRRGHVREERCQTSKVSRTVTPDVRDASPVRAPEWSFNELPERLVETGIP